MSTPQGYPDWQNYPAWRGSVFSNESGSCTTADPYQVTEYVTNWQSLFFQVSNPSQGCTVAATYWTGPFVSPAVANLFWVLNAGVEVACITPVLGNWLQFTVTTAEAGTCDFDVTLAPLNVPVAKSIYPLPGNASAGHNITLAASGTENLLMPQTMEGIAYFEGRETDAAGEIQFTIQDQNEAGTEIREDYFTVMPTATTLVQAQFAMQRYPINIAIRNNDAANSHTFNYSLTGLSQ